MAKNVSILKLFYIYILCNILCNICIYRTHKFWIVWKSFRKKSLDVSGIFRALRGFWAFHKNFGEIIEGCIRFERISGWLRSIMGFGKFQRIVRSCHVALTFSEMTLKLLEMSLKGLQISSSKSETLLSPTGRQDLSMVLRRPWQAVRLPFYNTSPMIICKCISVFFFSKITFKNCVISAEFFMHFRRSFQFTLKSISKYFKKKK